MGKEEKINIKAMCLFSKDGKVLVAKGFEKVKNENFYRLLGGSINFSETSEAGIRREIEEELQSEIKKLKLVDVVESLFVYEGNKGHEIVFIYTGDLARKELYAQNPIHIVEKTYEFNAEWIPMVDILNGKIPLYPTLDYKNLFKKL